ncbi:TMV resistance protein N [Vitis vinifera]|uniref:TMV resistance protein N n=1 Tax=Vitis vinifera TaxID=29760 RepID=A0A438E195_VITVI|nr:TMV resistance protein N [Vitis vinifera]
MGMEAIKGILLDLSIPKWIHITIESLAMMKNLSFNAEDLVELDMCYSSLKQLWENDMLLEKLNTIRLSCSQHLIEIPDISISVPNLEKLILDGCSSLLEVHPSIGKLNKLILLNLKNCKKLVCFPCIINMKALQILNFSGCSGLKKFPNIQGNMENLLELYLASIAIEELPSSIGHLTGLVLLDLKWCKNLKSLPTSICKLKSLEYLFLSGCSKLESFPEMMENMDNLKELLLDGTPIEVLPSSIERLKGLILLNLRKCKNLVSLSNGMSNLTSLEKLIVSGCSQLNNLPRNIGCLQRLAQLHADGTAITQPPDSIVLLRNLQVLIYPGCKILAPTSLGSLFSFWLLHRNSSNGISLRLPSGFSSFRSFTNLDLSDCKLIEGAIPKKIFSLISLKKLDLSRNNFLSIPAGIIELTNLKDLRLGQCQSLIEILELPPSVRDIDAHNFTALLPGSSRVSTLQGLQFLFYNCSKPVEDRSSDDKRNLKDFGHDFHWKGNIVGSEHVWLGYQPCSQLRLFQFNDPNDWNRIEISFEAAQRFISSASNVVKKCGICFIYAEDLEGIHLQNRKQLKRGGCNVVERSSDREGLNGGGT